MWPVEISMLVRAGSSLLKKNENTIILMFILKLEYVRSYTHHDEVLDLVDGELASGSRDKEVMRCGGSAACGGAVVVCCPDHLPDIRALHSS